MRAFIGQFDRVSLGVFLLGAAIGAVWLVALDLGVLLMAIGSSSAAWSSSSTTAGSRSGC